MKVFRLACSRGHDFEGWFASGEEFDRQAAAGIVSCPLCDDRAIAKLPSAPYVNTGARGPETVTAVATKGEAPQALATAIAAIKAYVVANTEDVGRQFPEVARRMHYGEESHRGIRGKVTAQEASELRDEGVEAVALPPGMALGDDVH